MNQDSRLFRRLGVLAATAVVALCFCRLAASAEEARKGKKEMTVIEKLAEQEKMLKKKLADDTLWTDGKRKDELLGYLKTVTTLRARSVAPVLVSWIAYDPNPDVIEKRKRPVWLKHPVYGALRNIGMPSVPYLLAEIKTTSPKNTGTKDSYLKHVLLTSCVWEIYDQGGYGLALAKKRLELELAATKDAKEKANLQAALDDPIFKEEKDTKKEQLRKFDTIQVNRIAKGLSSEKKNDRASTVDQVRQDKKELISRLIHLAVNGKGDEIQSEREMAIELLGDLRAIEAVDVLLKNIEFSPPTILLSDKKHAGYPCVRALVKIGKPASTAALAEAGRKDSNEKRLALLATVIRSVEGKKTATFLLKERKKEASSKKEKGRYAKAITALSIELP